MFLKEVPELLQDTPSQFSARITRIKKTDRFLLYLCYYEGRRKIEVTLAILVAPPERIWFGDGEPVLVKKEKDGVKIETLLFGLDLF
jgi:hypothetical protein